MEAVGVMEGIVRPQEVVESADKPKEKSWIRRGIDWVMRRRGLPKNSVKTSVKEEPRDMSTKAILARQDQRRAQENLYYGRTSLATVDRLTHEGFSSSQEDQVGGSIEAQRRLDEQIKKKQESVRLQGVRKELVAQGV